MSSFELVTEKTLAKPEAGWPVPLISICPTMDVVVLTTSPVQAAVHRLNWNRLCVVGGAAAADESQRIVSLAWHPSGRACTVARAGGQFDVVHVDSGHVVSAQAPLQSAQRVCSVAFVHQVRCEAECVYVDRAEQHFPKMSRLRKALDHVADGALTQATPHVSNAKLFRLFGGAPRVVPHLIVQSVLTADHTVLLVASDSLLPIAHADVAGELRRERDTDVVVRHCAVAPDLSAVVGVVQVDGQLHLTCRSGSRLWAHRGELVYLAHQRLILTNLVQELRATLATMRSTWKAALQPLRQKMAVLRGMLDDAGSNVSLELELEALVTTGRPSTALQQFMTQQLGEQMVKRLYGAVKQALVALQHNVSSFAPQLLDEFLFRVDDMRANAHWIERFAPLDVDAVATFEPLLAHARQLMHALSNLSVGVAIIARRYDAFWTFFAERVIAAHASAEEQQTGSVGDEQVLAYIKLDIDTDNVAFLLESTEPVPTPAARAPTGAPADTSTATAIRTWQSFLARFAPAEGAVPTFSTALDGLHATLATFLSRSLLGSPAAQMSEWCAVPLCAEAAGRQPFSLSFAVPDGYSCAYDFAANERKIDEAIATAMPAPAADSEHASQVACSVAVACLVHAAPADGQRTVVLLLLPSPLDAVGCEAQVAAFHFEARHVASLSYSRSTNALVVLYDGGSGGAQGQLSTFDLSALEFQPLDVEFGADEPLAERVLAALGADSVPLLAPSETRHMHRGKSKFSGLVVNHDRSLAAVQTGKRRLSLLILEGGGDGAADDPQSVMSE